MGGINSHRGTLKHQTVAVSEEKVYYYHTEDSVVQLLRDIETGAVTSLELFLQLKDVLPNASRVHHHPVFEQQQLISQTHQINNWANLWRWLIVSRCSDLFFVASFVLSGTCWVTPKQRLKTFDAQEKTNLLTAFSSHMTKMYSSMVAKRFKKQLKTGWEVIHSAAWASKL